MDRHRDYTKLSKSDRNTNIRWYHLYMEFKQWWKWNYLQDRNKLTDKKTNLWLPNMIKWGMRFSSVIQSHPTLRDPMDCSTPGFPVHHHLPELTQTHVCQVSDTIQPSCPLSSPSPPAFNVSQHQGLFKWISSSHQVAKVLEFSFNISPSNEHSGLISFRMDWMDLLVVQGTLKSLLQHHSSPNLALVLSEAEGWQGVMPEISGHLTHAKT